MATTGVCRLCERQGTLRNSHILPEFLYKPAYDPDHRAFHVTSARGVPTRRIQKGFRERLLCAKCEALLSRWETASAPPISAAARNAFHARSGTRVIQPVDYAATKLFMLSVLWRCSVASRSEFATISLGPHEVAIRKMLLANDPGLPHEYGCLLIAISGPHQLEHILQLPRKQRYDHFTVYVGLLAGLFWCFFATRRPPRPVEDFTSPSGMVMLVSDRTEDHILTGIARNVPQGKL